VLPNFTLLENLLFVLLFYVASLIININIFIVFKQLVTCAAISTPKIICLQQPLKLDLLEQSSITCDIWIVAYDIKTFLLFTCI